MSSWQAVRAEVWDRSGGSCHYCGHELHPVRDFTVDHVHPRFLGGTDDIENLVAACRDCNSRKQAKTLIEWKGLPMGANTNEEAVSAADALLHTLISPNELDSNLEPANVVDGLFAVARGLHHIARAIEFGALIDRGAIDQEAIDAVAARVKKKAG